MADEKSEAIASTEDDNQDTSSAEELDEQGNPNPAKSKEATTSPKTVEELEAELGQSRKETEQARRLQAQADRKARREKNLRLAAQRKAEGKDGHQDDDDESEGDEPEGLATDTVERERAELALQRASLNPKYRELIDKNPALQRVLDRNPLALVDNPIDKEDAVYQLEDYLDGLLSKESPAPKPKEKPEDTDEKPAPRTVTQNPKRSTDKGYKDSLKRGDINSAVIGKMRNPANWNKGREE